MLNKKINILFIAVVLCSSQIMYSSEGDVQQNLQLAVQLRQKINDNSINDNSISINSININGSFMFNFGNIYIGNKIKNTVSGGSSTAVFLSNNDETLDVIGLGCSTRATASRNVEKININFGQDPRNNRAIIYLPVWSNAQIIAQASGGCGNVLDVHCWHKPDIIAADGIKVNFCYPFSWSPLIVSSVFVGAIIFYYMLLKK